MGEEQAQAVPLHSELGECRDYSGAELEQALAGVESRVVPLQGSFETANNITAIYLTEAGQYPLLTGDEEVALAKLRDRAILAWEQLSEHRPRSIDEVDRLSSELEQGLRARELFIICNLRLVVSIAKRYVPVVNTLDLLDLIEEGNKGLMRATDKFKWEKGFKFSTYATRWIRQAIARGIDNTDKAIRHPVHTEVQQRKITKTKNIFMDKNGRQMTLDELAAELGVSTKVLEEHAKEYRKVDSYQQPISDDSGATREDFITDTEAGEVMETAETNRMHFEVIQLIFANLDERSQKIMALYHGLDGIEGRSYDDVGTYFGLTGSRIQQIEAKIKEKVRSDPRLAKLGDSLF